MKLFSFLLVASAAAFAPTTPHLSRSVVIKSPVMMPKDNPYTFATGTKPNAKSAYRPPRSTGDAQDSEVISTIGIFAFAGELVAEVSSVSFFFFSYTGAYREGEK